MKGRLQTSDVNYSSERVRVEGKRRNPRTERVVLAVSTRLEGGVLG